MHPGLLLVGLGFQPPSLRAAEFLEVLKARKKIVGLTGTEGTRENLRLAEGPEKNLA